MRAEVRLLGAQLTNNIDMYNKEDIMECALLCKTRGEFQKRFTEEAKRALSLGILDDLFPRKKKKYWTRELVLEAAKECSSRSDFQKKHVGAHGAAYRWKMLNDLFPYLPSHTRKTNKELKSIAAEFDNLNKFRKAHQAIYQAINRRGLLAEYTGHMTAERGSRGKGKNTGCMFRGSNKNNNSVHYDFQPERKLQEDKFIYNAF